MAAGVACRTVGTPASRRLRPPRGDGGGLVGPQGQRGGGASRWARRPTLTDRVGSGPSPGAPYITTPPIIREQLAGDGAGGRREEGDRLRHGPGLGCERRRGG